MAGTHTKITYDVKGLVTAGSDLVSADIPDLSGTYLNLVQGSGNANKTVITDATGNVVLGTAQSPVVTTLNGVQTNTPSWYAPVANGTTGQILYADANGAPTWEDAPQAVTVEDALNSTSTTNALSANMGRVLNGIKLGVATLSTPITNDMIDKTYLLMPDTELKYDGVATLRYVGGTHRWDRRVNPYALHGYMSNITYNMGGVTICNEDIYLSINQPNFGNFPPSSPHYWKRLTHSPKIIHHTGELPIGSKIYNINHNLSSYHIVYSFVDNESNNYIYPKVVRVSLDGIRVEFNTALTDSVDYTLMAVVQEGT